ncbi:EpsG family protein [Streptococcus equinus]|uniref:EpsG family protein n=1 Tax=Streptococcus equinus TaxID=1335 RepID=UPI0008B28B5F|nr:EpsG family protein [Streptococcus equinus]SEK73195.1 EpsG family protein [Streptococcus equinus]
MLPYIFVFSICLILSFFVDHSTKNGLIDKKIIIYCSIIVLILSLMAAFRNDDIGKDIIVYVIPLYKWAKAFDLHSYLKIGDIEIGFKIITYVIVNLFGNYKFLLFFIELIISSGFIKYFLDLRKKYNISFFMSMIIFVFYIYNDSFTMMRQLIAVVLIINSYEYLFEKKYVKTVLLFIVSTMFHSSSYIALFGYLFIVINSFELLSSKYKNFLNAISLAAFMLLIFSYKKLPIFQNMDKVSTYMNSSYVLNNIVISKSLLIIKLFFIVIGLIYLLANKKKGSKAGVYFLFLVIDFSIYLASFKMNPLSRFGFYFIYPAIIYFASAVKLVFNKKSRSMVCGAIAILFIFNWFFNYVINSTNSNTVPYKSDIMRINVEK